MKRLLIACLLGILLLPVPNGYAVQYGDLSSIRWCPCNPDEQFDSKGSVVMGRTVMCPCDSMYDGYGRTFEKDVRKVQEKVEHAYENALAYKYYIGFEYNKSQVETNNKKKNFNDVIFSSVHGIDVPSGEMIEHQDNIGVVLGFRPHKNFGMEVFYNRTYSDSETSTYDGTCIPIPPNIKLLVLIWSVIYRLRSILILWRLSVWENISLTTPQNLKPFMVKIWFILSQSVLMRMNWLIVPAVVFSSILLTALPCA